ncbi:MAG TPA: hypothetical protein VHC19_09530 [Pirellulales bacterium]|nr:hypothetical protein [Pirellulales bacterium]
MNTKFISIPATPDGARRAADGGDIPLVVVSRHGLGDNVFFSPCFEPLSTRWPCVYFTSAVNAYTTIFHESNLARALYAGSVNGAKLGLSTPEVFAAHFERLQLDLGSAAAFVYHFGLFDPKLSYRHESAFVKGRRNQVELFGDGPGACQTPRYHVAPDSASRAYVGAQLDRWLPGRELICIARYGHTGPGKNFGNSYQETLEVIRLLNARHPERFRFLSLDYVPGVHAADGRETNVRSLYGFLPCDAASLHHLLCRARVLVTVPSGPMLIGATIPRLKMITLWKTMKPFHYLDPQFDSSNPVRALVARTDLSDTSFMNGWPPASRDAVLSRWRLRVGQIDAGSVSDEVSATVEEV